MSLRNSQIIYILHLYEMLNFEYILRFENFIFLFCAYILVNDQINIFLKDRMRRFFKHSWFNNWVPKIRWRWTILNINCKFESSGWGVKIKLHVQGGCYNTILWEKYNCKTATVSFVIKSCRMLTIGVKY
jgi:hypothetical protein